MVQVKQRNDLQILFKNLKIYKNSKYKWLKEATEVDEEFSVQRSRTIASGLFPYSSQRGLAGPFAVEMIAQLPALDDAHNSTFHDNVSYFLIPRLCSEENVDRLKAAAKRYSELNPSIVRNLKIAAQLDERCVNIGALLAERHSEEGGIGQR